MFSIYTEWFHFCFSSVQGVFKRVLGLKHGPIGWASTKARIRYWKKCAFQKWIRLWSLSPMKYVNPTEIVTVPISWSILFTVIYFYKVIYFHLFTFNWFFLLYLGLQQSFGVDRHRQNLLMDTALLPFQIELDKHLQPFYDTLLKSLEGGSPSELTTSLKESHLWECQQLGVDSPIVLVFTMLYFNTKYYRLYTVEQHQQMAFTHLQKVSKKFANANKNATQKTFCLQFSPTQDGNYLIPQVFSNEV